MVDIRKNPASQAKRGVAAIRSKGLIPKEQARPVDSEEEIISIPEETDEPEVEVEEIEEPVESVREEPDDLVEFFNVANADDLDAVPGIGPKTIEEIVNLRETSELTYADLEKILGSKRIESIRQYLANEQ